MNERAFTLWTDLFNATERKPHFINDRCFGEDFAAWLQDRLTRAALSVSEPIQEDWGWCLVATQGGRRFTVYVGVMDDSIGRLPAEWRVGVSYERPMNGLKGMLLPVPVALLDALGEKLHRVLASEPSFRGLHPAT